MKRIDFLKCYAGALTSAWAFVIYAFVMYTYTKKDLLTIIVTYGAFVAFPAFMIPFLIVKEDNDEDSDGSGA